MSSALNDLRKLMARVKEKGATLNLEMSQVQVVPAEDENGRDMMMVTFVMTPEAVESVEETERRRTDDEFKALMSGIDLDLDDVGVEREDKRPTMDEARQEFLDSMKRKKDDG